MKKIIGILMMVIVLIAMASGLAYAGTKITQSDIDEGLNFCQEYPVRLALDGTEITFGEKDVPPVIIKERTLIPARALFEAMGGIVAWDNNTQSVNIKLDNTVVQLVIGSDVAVVNGVDQPLDVPAMILDPDGDYYGSTMIPVRFTAEALGCEVSWEDSTRSVLATSPKTEEPVIEPNEPSTEPTDGNTDTPTDDDSGMLDMIHTAAKDKLVVIDIGHGGKDCGSIGHQGQTDQLYEKDLNLPIGLKLNEYLKSAGVKTLLTRDQDVYLTLDERTTIANNNGATLFVSVHNNSNESSTPHGTEVLYNSKVNAEGKTENDLYGIASKTIAANVQDEMVSICGTYDRGERSSPSLYVLKHTVMPAIIVEGAFLSNESDLKMLRTSEFIDNYAYAVAKGIIKSLNDAYK
ncbi:N-acetylmuramoyl-L-alanine amidase [Clostridium aminobutyricum]|uniref:N-acetylmuramoyl-L-alanine amidase n=1 Tax=Clostridium aminobutyricum TaxID=33953 RepID=A0A939D853_CLOAM|nr:N-acetylmuramoyl-L-alanine amidase [Clostridium aminobutyricum]MBN7772837.1 N-acetylmuramoyl-L-alanine amidase [Clostridium aminobutyricum]